MRIERILNIPGIVIEEVTQQGGSPLLGRGRQEGCVECPKCGENERVRKRGVVWRTVRHSDVANQAMWLKIRGHKYECKQCGRYFNPRYKTILPRRKYTEAFRRKVVDMHAKGITQSELGRWVGLGSATVERWYQDYQHRKSQHWKRQTAPQYLGIDEHSFSKKMRYATTLCDLGKHQIVDVLPGKAERDLRASLRQMKGREKVKMVSIDLSEHYRALVKQYFPNACIVADRFHVIRLINVALKKTWEELCPKDKRSKGLNCLIRQHHWRLKPRSKDNLTRYLKENPAFAQVYWMKQALCKLLLKKHQTAKQCKRHIQELLQMIFSLQHSHFTHLVKLAETLHNWRDEIACMWRFTKNNGITEGFHRKMKNIQRAAYGFKNFSNYRLRVISLCGPIPFQLT